MRAYFIALCAILLFGNIAHAQQSTMEPINSCPEVANSYQNYGWIVRVHFRLQADCGYQIWAKKLGETASSGSGIAQIRVSDGTLIIPFKTPTGPPNERIELRRNWINLGGHAFTNGDVYEIWFHPKAWPF